jgi:hypothetical protein
MPGLFLYVIVHADTCSSLRVGIAELAFRMRMQLL